MRRATHDRLQFNKRFFHSKLLKSKTYFTSSGPQFLTYHLEVYMAYIFCHSIWYLFYSDKLSGISSDILSGILFGTFWLSIYHLFRHSFWHSFWHAFGSRPTPQHPELAIWERVQQVQQARRRRRRQRSKEEGRKEWRKEV